jgi:hypothetical protein
VAPKSSNTSHSEKKFQEAQYPLPAITVVDPDSEAAATVIRSGMKLHFIFYRTLRHQRAIAGKLSRGKLLLNVESSSARK